MAETIKQLRARLATAVVERDTLALTGDTWRQRYAEAEKINQELRAEVLRLRALVKEGNT